MAKLSLRLEPKVTPTVKQKVVPTVVTSQKLEDLCVERLQVAAKLSQLEPKKKELDTEILKIANKKNAQGAVDVGDYEVRRTDAKNRYLNPAKLLHYGVKASIIEKCYDETPYSYPRVTRKKQVAEESAE